MLDSSKRKHLVDISITVIHTTYFPFQPRDSAGCSPDVCQPQLCFISCHEIRYYLVRHANAYTSNHILNIFESQNIRRQIFILLTVGNSTVKKFCLLAATNITVLIVGLPDIQATVHIFHLFCSAEAVYDEISACEMEFSDRPKPCFDTFLE